MTQKTIYVIGSPAAGKTTLCKAFLEQFEFDSQETLPVKHEIYKSKDGHVIVSLGWQTGVFGGTDILPNTAIEKVLLWLPQLFEKYENFILFAEGDRLSSDRFFDAVESYAPLKLVYVDTPEDVAQQRREQRATENNLKLQNASWVKGRVSKCQNLSKKHPHLKINGDLATGKQLESFNEYVLAIDE